MAKDEHRTISYEIENQLLSRQAQGEQKMNKSQISLQNGYCPSCSLKFEGNGMESTP